jgi:hypothetical protein
MPKQRITFQRTETITFEFDYKADPHTKANLEFWANQGYCGGSPIGKPDAPIPLALLLTEWKLQSSSPPACVCVEAKAKPKAKKRI